MIKILPIPRRPLDCLSQQGRVFWMRPFESKLHRWFRRSVILKDSVGFIRPDDLAGGGNPAEAPCMTEPLSFRQVGLASPLSTLAPNETAVCILQGHRSQ